MRFAHFERSTGKIIAILEMTESCANLQRCDATDIVRSDNADPVRHIVDPVTKQLVEKIPPCPGDEFEWSPDQWRWIVKPDVAERNALRQSVIVELEMLDKKQARPALELALDPSNEDARSRLQEILNRKAELRLKLK